MIELLIEHHKKQFADNVYELVDPNFKLNSVNDYKPTQDEIIQGIKENKLNNIEIKYFGDFIIKYTQLNENEIKFSPMEPNSVHLLRLVGLKQIPKYLFDFDIEVQKENLKQMLVEIYNYINPTLKLNPMDFCSVCGVELGLKGLNKISCCNNEFCKISSKHIVIDNRITDMYKKDPFLCELLIDILIEGTTHPKEEKIFKPLPQIKNISNLKELKILIEKEIVNLDIKKIASSSNDIDLHKTIGSNAYSIISNAISDNYFSLSTIERFQSEVLNSGKPRLENEEKKCVFNSSDVKFIGLNYSYEIESKFKKEYFLFHGTPIYSWYPIVKNGLKVMSGTEFQANGAAYGNGIYLSDQFSMSLGYSTRANNNNKVKNNKSRTIVGVFEIAGGIEQHRKIPGIFVVDDDKIMLLRYLIVIEGILQASHYQELSDYFVKYLGSINKLNEKKSINIKNKRLNAEIKLLNSNNKVFQVEMIGETTNWKIILNEIKGKKIVLNVYFNDYPKLPPKISLETNLNLMKKKNICDNNSNIIISEINPSNWEITTNLSKIVDILYNCISNTL
jgi:hypothetical protein